MMDDMNNEIRGAMKKKWHRFQFTPTSFMFQTGVRFQEERE